MLAGAESKGNTEDMADETGGEDEGEDDDAYMGGDEDYATEESEEDGDEGGDEDDALEVSEEGGDLATPAPADE